MYEGTRTTVTTDRSTFAAAPTTTITSPRWIMLSESYVASTLSCDASSRAAAATKNAAISIQPLHPNAATTTAPTTAKACFKNSSTAQNGLAVSATHVFAAQHEKAVVHVYSRERQHQEAIVPFPERIQSVAFAGDYAGGAGFLVLGTQGGRVIVWEVRVCDPPDPGSTAHLLLLLVAWQCPFLADNPVFSSNAFRSARAVECRRPPRICSR